MLKRSGGEGEKIRQQTRAEKTNLMNGHVVWIQLETPWNNTYRHSFYVTAMGLRGRSFGKAGYRKVTSKSCNKNDIVRIP